jgi:hypothetical protein
MKIDVCVKIPLNKSNSRNICLDPFLVPGGGAVEMEVSHQLKEKSNEIKGIAQLPYREIATALEIIPRNRFYASPFRPDLPDKCY